MKENSNHALVLPIACCIFSLLFVFMFFVSLNDYQKSKTTYQDLIYKEFTVESVREKTYSDADIVFYIDVVEEEKNIKINNVLTHKNVNAGTRSLQKGDKIYCYLIEKSSNYEIVELKKEDSTILSLDQYNEIYKRESILGFLISPIGFAIVFGFSVIGFVAYKRELG